MIGAVTDEELLRHALRVAIDAAVQREQMDITPGLLAPYPPTLM